MITPGSANPLLFSADEGYNLTRSLRFRRSAGGYLSRTAGAGNQQIMTLSFWFKRGQLGVAQYLFGSYANGSAYTNIYIESTDQIGLADAASGTNLLSTQVFRDPSAWYHIVVAIDTTQATAANRVKFYVNNVQITAFASSTYPAQNTNLNLNSACNHTLFNNAASGATNYTDGYQAETNFIGGQQLTPSSFGSTNTLTGVWQPARYTGTYGTNGFYLPFKTSVSDNIIVYYPGVISGSSVINAEGSTNGTKGSGVSSTTGKVGDGFQFDGTINGYIDTGVTTNYTSAFSVGAWINTTSTNTQFLVSKGSYYAVNTSDFPFHLSMNSNGSISAALDSGNGDYNTDLFITSSTTGYNDGNWHYVAFTFTSSTAKIYVDGTEVASASTGFSISSTSYGWTLGRAAYPYGGGSPGNPYTGKIDDFKLFSRAITASEVASLYSNGGQPQALGYDNSGSGNHWNLNNISLTPGTTYDSMTDVPTLTSATAANFPVFNPLIPSGQTITQGNLLGINEWCQASINIPNTGKWYAEFTCYQPNSVSDSNNFYVVVGTAYYAFNGNKYSGGWVSYGASYTNGDVIGAAVDIPNGTVTYYKNNVSQGSQSITANAGTFFAIRCINTGNGYYANFGQRPFTYTPPTGYVALNTYNLPTSTIVKGNTVMDATIWTGDGSSPRTITNSAGFKPDLVWAKNRSTSGYWNVLFDSVRGAGNQLSSNETDAELASASNVAGKVSAFNSNGFSLATGSSSIRSVNGNTETYVGWQWQAGQGTTSSNTSGTITSTVSVNASAGFSVVTYTTPATNTFTVGHGLGVAPSLIFVKGRNQAYNWDVYHASLGATGRLILNTTSAFVTTSGPWANTAPTSTVFSSSGNGVYYNTGDTLVAYCWAPIAGYSAFGSYTGNGSTDGPFVYTGFRPKFVMAKRSDSISNWNILDGTRDPYNVVGSYLYPNSSAAEGANASTLDFTSNGFKIRQTYTDWNASGGTYIYMAFAENPFKNALAR